MKIIIINIFLFLIILDGKIIFIFVYAPLN